MSDEDRGEELLQDSFFDGRLLVRVESWEPNLHLGLGPGPKKYLYQGAVIYTRSFDLQGRIVAPKARRGRPIRVHVMAVAPKLLAGARSTGVGQLHISPDRPEDEALSINLYLPDHDLAYVATCLAATWKYLHVWTWGEHEDGANVDAYTFSSDIHPNLDAWIAEA